VSGLAEGGERTPAPAGVAVDVGIPTYGKPAFLAEAIESVLAQTHAHWRLLVSEDGPASEEVAAIVERYAADERVTYRATGTHVGAAANLTGLVRDGTAPYVAILHDDDRWEPTFLDARVRYLEAHPDSAFVFSGNSEIDATGATIGHSRHSLAEGPQEPAEFAPLLFRRNVICTPTVLVRRQAYEAVGPEFDARFGVMYDYEMWLRLALRFPIGFLARSDAAYRRHAAQTTFVARDLGLEWLRLLDHFDELGGTDPALRVTARRRAGALLSAALDTLESRRPEAGWRFLAAAVRAHPLSALDPRAGAALVALALGPASAPLLGRARRFVHKRGIRLHLSTP
jgi:glycosyltransferase involved in cell wall biosynthesis